MVLNVLIIFLGVKDLPKKAQDLVTKAVISVFLLDLVWNLSAAFYVLYIIETVGIEQLGILIATSFLVQAALDYPSGVLGDWIGQKFILFIGFSLEALAFGTLVFANSFPSLMIVYILRAIAFSQQSGAIGTWLDNNYKLATNEEDPDRKIYKFFVGRWATIANVTPGIAIAIGGLLATIYYRKAVFSVQVIGLSLIAFLFLLIIKDLPEIERPKRSLKNYFALLGEGLQFVLFNRTVLLFMIGLCISETVIIIWAQMMLFPVYYGYTGSDVGIGFLRFVILLIGTPLTFFAAKVAARCDLKWIPWLRFSDTAGFFWGIALLTAWIPINNNSFNPTAIVLILLIYSSVWFFHNVGVILRQRLFLDLIPDRNRNSIYSLIPTILLIASTPGIIIGASMIQNYGVPTTSFFLGAFGAISILFFHLSMRTIQINTAGDTIEFLEKEGDYIHN
ncbi:MAG: MFS transporter [Candidatus Hodarchaeota archaeon]